MSRRFNRNFFAVLHDTVMAAASFVLALYLRLGNVLLDRPPPHLVESAAAFALLAMGIFASMRLYRGLWRYASMQDLWALSRAATLAVVLFYGGLFMVTRLEGIPRSVPVIHLLVFMAMLGGPLVCCRR